MIKIIKVTGNSLSPFFLPGDYVLVLRAPCLYKHLSPGDFVVFDHSEYGRLIKQVNHNNPSESYIETEGVHPDSLSSVKIGKVHYEDIIGRVFRRVHRKD